MSLGWQTESALVPRASKPIAVDSKSMVSLKALVYSKELEHSRHANALDPNSKRKLRAQQTKAQQAEADLEAAYKKKQRKEEGGAGNEASVVYSSLKAKAELYDAIARQKDTSSHTDRPTYSTRDEALDPDRTERYDGQSVLAAYSKSATCLIDFSVKSDPPHATASHSTSTSSSSTSSSSNTSSSSSGNINISSSSSSGSGSGSSTSGASTLDLLVGDVVEIEDAFGRTVQVRRRSQEYENYLASKREAELAKSLQREIGGGGGGVGGGGSRGARGANSDSNRRDRAGDTDGGEPGQWAWSRGEGEGDGGEVDAVAVRNERSVTAAVQALLDKRMATEVQLSDASRVKTQWEKALNNSSRIYLDEIHDAAEGGRRIAGVVAGAGVGVGASAETSSSTTAATGGCTVGGVSVVAAGLNSKDARRELLRQKQMKAAGQAT